ncbi:MAG: hypothetical protein EPO00_09200 [Chloroflexota bacterium]|nr:MAG: hypothetical protein EPO00_09200 [Chloroflexota bacterium]
MTAFPGFDPFERRISEAFEEITDARRPDYLDDILQLTARTSQRPRWTFPERWLPVDLATRRPTALMGVRLRPMLLFIALALVLAALAASYVGSQRTPLPFGLARNGLIAYPKDGALYVRNALDADGHLILRGEGTLSSPYFSPDGKLLGYVQTIAGVDHLMVANADGSNVRELLKMPVGDWNAVWRPDSRALAAVVQANLSPRLSIVPIDGSAPTPIELGSAVPTTDLAWRPPAGEDLLVRGRRDDRTVDMFIVPGDGSPVHALGLPSELLFGTDWDNSGPVWTLDGARIAYNRVAIDPASGITNFRVHIVNADGTGDQALPGPADPKVMEAWPAFSPDGRTILVHRWTWKSNNGGEGWVAVLPADGSGPARDIGPRIPGGEDTGLIKTWSPDGTRVLMRSDNTREAFSIDPMTGAYERLDWTSDLPDWQRVAR